MIWSPTVGPFIVSTCFNTSKSLVLPNPQGQVALRHKHVTDPTIQPRVKQKEHPLRKPGTDWKRLGRHDPSETHPKDCFQRKPTKSVDSMPPKFKPRHPKKKHMPCHLVNWSPLLLDGLHKMQPQLSQFKVFKVKMRRLHFCSCLSTPNRSCFSFSDSIETCGPNPWSAEQSWKNRTMDVSHRIEPVGKQFQTCKATKYGKTRQNQRTSKV